MPSAAHDIPGRSEWCRPIPAPIGPRRNICRRLGCTTGSDDVDRVPHGGPAASSDSCARCGYKRPGLRRRGIDQRMIKPFPGICCSEAGRLVLGTTSNIGCFSASSLPSFLRQAHGLSGEHGRGVGGRRGHLPEARPVLVADAPLTSPEFAEALRPFCKDVLPRSDRLGARLTKSSAELAGPEITDWARRLRDYLRIIGRHRLVVCAHPRHPRRPSRRAATPTRPHRRRTELAGVPRSQSGPYDHPLPNIGSDPHMCRRVSK